MLFLSALASRPGRGRGSGVRGRGGGKDAGRGRGVRDRDRGGRGIGKSRDDGKSFGKALPISLARTRTSPKLGESIRPEMSTMPMQRLFMTNENQEQLKELLRNLQTQDFDEPYE